MNETPWPDVLDLFKYWSDYPPPHIALNHVLIYLGAKSPNMDRQRAAELNSAEKQIAAESNVRSFKRLPKHVQQFVQEVNSGKFDKAG